MNRSLPRRPLAGFTAAVLIAAVPASVQAAGTPTGSAVDSREAPSIMQREAQAHASLPTKAVPAPITLTPRAAATRAAAGLASPRALASAGGALNREVFGFAPYWALASGTSLSNGTLSDLQYDKLSTVAYFGLHLDSSGNFVADSGMAGWNSSQMNDLVANAHANGVRVELTAICFNEADINAIVSNPATGQNAINNVIAAVKQRGLDGVDIDFEGSTSSTYPNIQQGFTGWVHSLSTQLRQQVAGAVLTVDTYSGSASWSGGFMRIDTLAPYVDAFFVMAYDMGLSNTSPGQPGTLPNAPLAGGYTYTDTTSVDQYIQKGGDPHKVILGVPYYGYKFSTTGTGFNAAIQATATGCFSACADPYSTILSEFACAPQLQVNWDASSTTPWASWYSPASGDPCGGNHGSYRELYYDNAASLGAKYDLVNGRNIRGSGIWALGYDHGTTDLWDAIATKYEGPCHGGVDSLTTAHATPQVAAMGLDSALWVHQSGCAGFSSLGGILLAAPAVVPRGASTDPYYIATGRDHDLYVRTASAAWQHLVDAPVACIDSPAGVVVAGVLWVGCQGIDHALWAGHETVPGSGLTQTPRASWRSLGGILVNGPSAVVIGGGPAFFVIGTDHHVYWRAPTSSTYTSNTWLCYGHPATASYAGTAYFACNGADTAAWYSTNSGAGWAAAASLGGILVGGPGVAAGPAGPTFYVEGRDTAVWERTLTSGWGSDGGLVQYGVSAAWVP